MSSGFISEAEIAEQRRLRQEEWDRVRTTDQPQDAPEEKYDPRSLFDRLQEQKNKKDIEYEEAHKLKNMIKGLDDDEVEFLDLVDRTKLEEERKKNLEEEKEMRDFKAAVASLQEKSMDEKLKQELKKPQIAGKKASSNSGKSSQLRLLAGVIAKKSGKNGFDIATRGSKRKLSELEGKNDSDKEAEEEEEEQQQQQDHQETTTTITGSVMATESTDEAKESSVPDDLPRKASSVGLKCIGILPGLGSYDDSSDSDCSSSDSDREYESASHVKYDSNQNPPKSTN